MRPAIPRWFIAACFLTFSPFPVDAATQWSYFSSPDLVVVGSVSEDAVLGMARRLTLFRQLFLKRLGISRDGPPLRVYLFETDRDLHPFVPLKDRKPIESSGFLPQRSGPGHAGAPPWSQHTTDLRARIPSVCSSPLRFGHRPMASLVERRIGGVPFHCRVGNEQSTLRPASRTARSLPEGAPANAACRPFCCRSELSVL